jgi:Glycosyl hydrolases family 32 C terminal
VFDALWQKRRQIGMGHSTDSAVSATPLDIQGAALEIVAAFLPSQAAQFGLKVRCAQDGSEQILIAFDPCIGWPSIDREPSSLDPAVHR